MNEWNSHELEDIQTAEAPDLPDESLWILDEPELPATSTELPPDTQWLAEDDLTEGEKAAGYLRELGTQDRLADYVQRHYDDAQWSFSPDLSIPITTRNQSLEGQHHNAGVLFTRQEVDMGDGVFISGVFPEFESRFDVELQDDARSMPLTEQFEACRKQFQDHMFDDPAILAGLTLEDMDHLVDHYTPDGFSWNHNAAPGSFSLVDRDIHRGVGHTGGNALWTPAVRKSE